ncbi:sugar kinase [Rhizobium sp. YIM 134829]|uniref:sugar kinase n=1 Tax=Rhizobium sp. YIM 134829 TaxID=3390453 RepID=UPI0039786AC9
MENTSRRFVSVGECMVELTGSGPDLLRKGYAGDTFNAAYYARLALPDDWSVDYVTALGTDAVSDEMIAFMRSKHINTEQIQRLPHRLPGLYMVHVHEGERSFSYWRSTSAARQLAADEAALSSALEGAEILVFSGITLAILEGDGRQRLIEAMQRARGAGAQVVFDPNIRPRLWEDAETMRKTIMDGAGAATLLMPSFDDEATHFGDADVTATIARYRAAGVPNVVVKNGADGVTLAFGGETIEVSSQPVETVVDTTSAGDSFNGSFLAHLAVHDNPRLAAQFAAKVAAHVIQHPGAIVAHDLRP